MDSIKVADAEFVSVHAFVPIEGKPVPEDRVIGLSVSVMGAPNVAPTVGLSLSDSRKLRELLEAAERRLSTS